MNKVHFGLVVPGDALDKARRHGYIDAVNRLLDCVKGHYHSAWFIDHLQFGSSDLLEGWTALSFLSALHPELQWGHSVICQGFRNPALLAKMGATLQMLSGGRFILGIGAGSDDEEHRAYGYNFASGSDRVEQLDEALRIIKAMWTQERATFEGRHYRVNDAWCEPKPEPMPPIMVGAFRPKMLRVAAKHADWWNVSSTGIDAYRGYVQEFERACEEVGRDANTVRRSWCGGCICARNEEEITRMAASRLEAGENFAYQIGEDFVGTPAQVIEQMQPFIELGVDYFMLDCGGFPQTTTVELLVNEVLPVLNR